MDLDDVARFDLREGARMTAGEIDACEIAGSEPSSLVDVRFVADDGEDGTIRAVGAGVLYR